MVIEKEQCLQKSQEECIRLKVDLLEQSKQGKRYVFLKQIIVFVGENFYLKFYLIFKMEKFWKCSNRKFNILFCPLI